jgi:hypothetical protein
MMIQTYKLQYADHGEEITTLNKILASIQAHYPLGYPEGMHAAVIFMLARLDQLMSTDKATLKPYDQRESRA